MVLTENCASRATIVVAADAPWLERHAAEEFTAYVRRISGAGLVIANQPPDDGSVVLIGRAAELGGRAAPRGDEFVIRTSNAGGRQVLALAGGSDRATLWAVYALLEDVIGVGFFRDGEQVPKLPTIILPELDIHEKPRFQDRFDGNGCIFTYTCSAWGFDEWRREFDWKAKRRVTQAWPMNVGGETMGRVLYDWGVLDAPPREPREPSLHQRVHDYGHSLGIEFPVSLPGLGVPDVFFQKYPDARSMVMQWSELEPKRTLHPADPRFKQLLVDYIRAFTERYGTDHLYIAEFQSESRVLEGESDVQSARIQFVEKVSEAIREADPDGVWAPGAWSFDIQMEDLSRPWDAAWTPEDVRGYLAAIDVPFIVHDLWSEEAAKYERLDWYFGHPWGFGVLHSFGAGGTLHGDIPELLRRAKEVVTDPRGRNCVMFLNQPEMIDFNSFYLELAARISWNPARVDLDEYVNDYARLRYGDAGKRLSAALRLLVETVHGPDTGSVKIFMDPLYWMRPDLELLHGWPEDRAETLERRKARPGWLPKLRRAAEMFLAETDVLAENPMAVRDLIDIVRHWIAERFNIAIVAGRDAFLAGHVDGLEMHAAECRALLAEQARLLACWPAYRLDRKIERHRGKWGDDATRAVKHTHVWVTTAEDQHSPPLRDYYRQDLDGLVADYYAVRVDAYFALLRAKLDGGIRTVDEQEWDALYTPIEENFIASPARPLPEGDPVNVARELVAEGEAHV